MQGKKKKNDVFFGKKKYVHQWRNRVKSILTIFLGAKLEITNYGFKVCFETWSRRLSSNYENVQLVYENLLGEEVLIQC